MSASPIAPISHVTSQQLQEALRILGDWHPVHQKGNRAVRWQHRKNKEASVWVPLDITQYVRPGVLRAVETHSGLDVGEIERMCEPETEPETGLADCDAPSPSGRQERGLVRRAVMAVFRQTDQPMHIDMIHQRALEKNFDIERGGISNVASHLVAEGFLERAGGPRSGVYKWASETGGQPDSPEVVTPIRDSLDLVRAAGPGRKDAVDVLDFLFEDSSTIPKNALSKRDELQTLITGIYREAA